MTSPVFRFAPSPNGRLHLGHALSALLNHDLARAATGRFLLRIEDIDIGRSRTEYESGIYDDLSWLGLSWEEPVRRQSQHMRDYATALEKLKFHRLVYPCFCSRGDIRTAAAEMSDPGEPWPSDPDGAPIYPGTCRHRPPPERQAALQRGEPHVWRLDMARIVDGLKEALTWSEEDHGEVLADPTAWGDVVVARRDIPTSYHLSVVVDDALQQITHVVRGRDLYHATAVHRVLQHVLGLPAPRYRHHRLIIGPDGRKLSKSAGSETLAALRGAGVTPTEIRARVGL